MITRKIFRMASFALLLAIALPASSAVVSSDPLKTTGTEKTENARAQVLMQRLEEIKAMDKSELTRLEKKALRNEVRDIKKEAKEIKGGVYLSVGAIIIVILLLILLL